MPLLPHRAISFQLCVNCGPWHAERGRRCWLRVKIWKMFYWIFHRCRARAEMCKRNGRTGGELYCEMGLAWLQSFAEIISDRMNWCHCVYLWLWINWRWNLFICSSSVELYFEESAILLLFQMATASSYWHRCNGRTCLFCSFVVSVPVMGFEVIMKFRWMWTKGRRQMSPCK